MNAPFTPKPPQLQATRPGFTLVEILVVVVIIGILAAFVLPATMRAVQRAREAEARMEVSALADAVEQYQQKYGDYPPDGSDWNVMQRHMRKLGNRLASPDMALLEKMTHTGPDGEFSSVAMDRAEALVFFLGGFSSDSSHPITGPGGPLSLLDPANQGSTDLSHYQYNATRENVLFEFEPERLTFALRGGRYRSTDEEDMGYADAAHGGTDLLPAYRSTRAETPIVYFDSRTYGRVGSGSFNGYLAPGDVGGIRPYKTSIGAQHPPEGSSYGSVTAAFNAVKFHNRDTFQIISPGGDGVFGAMVSVDPGDPAAQPVHFVTESGNAVTPNADATSLGQLELINGTRVNGFQDQDWNQAITINGHLDNITNFSSSTMESDLP